MPHDNPLADRWRSPAGMALAEEVIARLIAGRPTTDLDLDEHDGLVDLRYLPARLPQHLERFESQGWFVETLGQLLTFRQVTLTRLDLSGAQLQSLRFHGATVSGCRFEQALCRDWRLWDTKILGCNFSGADLREAAIGTWHGGHRNEWRNVDFTGADLRGAVSSAALFEDCAFERATLDGLLFQQCALVRCSFAGTVREVVFDCRELPDRALPHDLEDVDLRHAHLEAVEFLGCRLDRVAVPLDPDVRLIRHYRCVVEFALRMLQGDETSAARMLRGELQNALRMMRSSEEEVLFNERDYREPEELARLAREVFAQAQAACG